MRVAGRIAAHFAFVVAVGVSAAGARDAQVALDHIVARVNGRIVTESDVRQARLLRLVDGTESDASAQRALEDRILILGEIARLPPLPPTSDASLAAHRADWERRMGGAASAREALQRVAMNENTLGAWLRDDLRIRAHLARQFGGVPDADRDRAIGDWINRLRSRAGLQ